MQDAQDYEYSPEINGPKRLARIARALIVGTCCLTAFANQPASGGSDDDDDPTIGDFSDKDIPLGDCDIGGDDCVETDGFPETPGSIWQDTEGDSSADDDGDSDDASPEPFD